jgi:hypothetical protein
MVNEQLTNRLHASSINVHPGAVPNATSTIRVALIEMLPTVQHIRPGRADLGLQGGELAHIQKVEYIT